MLLNEVVDEALQVLENRECASTMKVPWIYWKQQAHWSIAIPRLPASHGAPGGNGFKAAPAQFLLYSLDGKPIITYGSNTTYFDPGSAAVTILDHATGRQRAPLTGDLVQFVKRGNTPTFGRAVPRLFVRTFLRKWGIYTDCMWL